MCQKRNLRLASESVSSKSGEEVELRELFDLDDIVDRWVFMLAGVVADLATMESVFKKALHSDDAPPAHRFYLQRQLGARIVEADRVVLAIWTAPGFDDT
jgi:hypothetical protein